MSFQLCDPNQPRGWVTQLNESLGYLKSAIDRLDTNLPAEKEAVRAEVDRARRLVAEAELTNMQLHERVQRLETRVAKMESR